MSGLFETANESRVRTSLPLVPKCGACGIFKTCQSPKMKVQGKGERGVLIVGPFPESEDDEKGKFFSGPHGQYLRKHLQSINVDMRDDCWLTSALICHPPNNYIKDANAVEYCQPNVIKTIKELKPISVILIGQEAVKSVIGFCWKPAVGDINRWTGWQIPAQRINAWIHPTWHVPSFTKMKKLRKDDPVLEKMFREHLMKGFKHETAPYEKIPNYKKQVEILREEDEIRKAIKGFSSSRRPVAFDYETNMLKPDNERTRDLACVSFSDGIQTVVFWLTTSLRELFIQFLRSNAPKIASNMKFEQRWSRAFYGVKVKNWIFDTMLAAHVLDNRHEITSIKFQSFVTLGQQSYDDHIHPYLVPATKEGGGYDINRVREAPATDLLTYCGLDSLLEWHVAKVQTKQMNHRCHKLFKEN